jgi:hypothetical protein
MKKTVSFFLKMYVPEATKRYGGVVIMAMNGGL